MNLLKLINHLFIYKLEFFRWICSDSYGKNTFLVFPYLMQFRRVFLRFWFFIKINIYINKLIMSQWNIDLIDLTYHILSPFFSLVYQKYRIFIHHIRYFSEEIPIMSFRLMKPPSLFERFRLFFRILCEKLIDIKFYN